MYMKEMTAKDIAGMPSMIMKEPTGMHTQHIERNARIEGDGNGRWCAIMQNVHHRKKGVSEK